MSYRSLYWPKTISHSKKAYQTGKKSISNGKYCYQTLDCFADVDCFAAYILCARPLANVRSFECRRRRKVNNISVRVKFYYSTLEWPAAATSGVCRWARPSISSLQTRRACTHAEKNMSGLATVQSLHQKCKTI